MSGELQKWADHFHPPGNGFGTANPLRSKYIVPLKNLRAVQSPTQNGKTLEELCLWEGDVYKLTAVYDGTAYWRGKDRNGRDLYDYGFWGGIGNREERFQLRCVSGRGQGESNFRYATPVEIAQYRSKYEF